MTAPSDGDLRKEYLANRAVPHMRKNLIKCQATMGVDATNDAAGCSEKSGKNLGENGEGIIDVTGHGCLGCSAIVVR